MTAIAYLPAEPEHLDQVAALHAAAFDPDDNLLAALGPRVIEAAYRWFWDDPGSVVLVAVREGEVAGFTSITDRPYVGPLIRGVAGTALRQLVRRPRLLLTRPFRERLMRLLRRGPDAPEGAHVAYTAVAPASQGLGIGRGLKDASIQWCRDIGIGSLITVVDSANEASRRMNESAGFVEVPEARNGEMLTFVLTIQDGEGR